MNVTAFELYKGFRASRLMDQKVMGPNGKQLGDVKDVIVNRDGKIAAIVVEGGGFLDIGDLVTNAVVGSRFGLSLAWVVVVGVVGICLFAQMSGKVAAVSGRATFEIIRERLGPRAALGVAALCLALLVAAAVLLGFAHHNVTGRVAVVRMFPAFVAGAGTGLRRDRSSRSPIPSEASP